MIIVDTGFWVALFNNKDQYHLIAQQTLAQYSSQPLITTWCVLTESCHQSVVVRSEYIRFLNIAQGSINKLETYLLLPGRIG